MANDYRKEDVEALCNAVLEMDLEFFDNPNGGYEYTCPFCRKYVSVGGKDPVPTMNNFKHDPHCGYLIAKDLMTKGEKND